MRRGGKKKFLVFRTLSEFGASTFLLTVRSVPAMFFIAGLLLAMFQIRNYLYADSYFQVSAIKVYPRGVLSPVEYARLERECRGKNLLTINLSHLHQLIIGNPDIKEVEIQRRLPTELVILITPRRPAVELSVSPKGEYYTLDEDGVVMAVNKTSNSKMVQWIHYNYRQKKFSLFDRYKDISLKQFPSIIRAFQGNEATKNEKISEISINHLGEFSVKLLNGPEVKICEDPFQTLKKISAMGHLLQSEERANLLYMNLCLNDVVVQYKTK